MLNPADEVVVRPEVVLLETLLAEVAAGRLRVPQFQRGFVWRPKQMLDLYDSIERGYPIGSVLVWQTGTPLYSQDHVAGIDIPAPPADEPVAYLLDGNQRLSTLFGTLARRPASRETDPREDPWWIYRTLGEDCGSAPAFVHWDRPGSPPATYLPMQAVLRTVDFLRYARALATDSDRAEELLEEAEQLTQRIRSYQIAVIRMIGGSLSHAVVAFARLNSAGQKITPLEMASALTYRPAIAENLNTGMAAIRERVGAGGFGQLPIETVFQAVLAVAGERDVLTLDLVDLAKRIPDLLGGAATRAEAALHRVVRFLRYEAGVPLAWLLPYPMQAVLLARFFHLVPEPDQAQVRSLVRWFWATSWSGALAEGNGARISRAIDQIEAFASGTAELSVSGHTAAPMPDWFDPDNGRSKAYILWELRSLSPRLDRDGQEIDVVALLAEHGAGAYRKVFVAEQDLLLSPANHLLMPAQPGTSIEETLLDIPAHLAGRVLRSHGIPAEALIRLRALLADQPDPETSTQDDQTGPGTSTQANQRATDDELSQSDESGDLCAATPDRAEAERAFIEQRAIHLAEREQAFIRELGITQAAAYGQPAA